MKKETKHEKYYLTGADGKEYEVSEEIFREYKHSVWNEEAQYKRERSVIRDKNSTKSDLDKVEHIKVASLESIVTGGGEHHIGVTPDFAEELADAIEKTEMLKLLGQALDILDESEKEMIGRLFYENISEREYEKKYRTARKTVAYRKEKILKKLKSLIINKR
ncbi:sigma-70 family RNA polymerase sigma factor [Clostridium beijerinckii]|uniref:Sigma-70 family RNA polymerase sigma factor n=1 Tax=Clostridium beijerinckii TaxID=1520 RepID=A0A1S8S707_CLOBE|nr:sigma-70 family RNA polymerase sigma factor [Clostridium beijerinckii]NRY61483.1 DNA-directed RNA polymerase specialized sigma subunit [Clostridium beijerinckii]OOM61270.1 hypothetical protein CLBCK_24040 [Clostridium beijerinckii]